MSCGMVRHAGWLRLTDVSNDRSAFILRIKSSCRIDTVGLFNPEDEGTTIFRNDGNCLSVDTAYDSGSLEC
jgi:hypothetical protein